EDREPSGPAEAVDADDRNEIPREHHPCVGPRCQFAQMLLERRSNRSQRSRAALFRSLRHLDRLTNRSAVTESVSIRIRAREFRRQRETIKKARPIATRSSWIATKKSLMCRFVTSRLRIS